MILLMNADTLFQADSKLSGYTMKGSVCSGVVRRQAVPCLEAPPGEEQLYHNAQATCNPNSTGMADLVIPGRQKKS